MKKYFSILTILVLLCSCSKKEDGSELIIETQNGKAIFEVEIADTPEKMQKGLMFRKSMPKNHGMIFDVKPAQIITMWMKNTFISLDMIFVSENGTINQIIKNTTPESEKILGKNIKSRAVIELNAGQADKHDIHVGDKVRHKIFNNI